MEFSANDSQTSNDLVVIVDDDPDFCKSTAALVETRGVRIEAFTSAEHFIESFDWAQSACVILDVRMAGMSGLDLQQQMIDNGIDLPVVIVTAYGDVPMAVRAMQAGAVSFLCKPCSPENLWKGIQLGLDRERKRHESREQEAAIVRGLWSLSADERQVLDKLIEGLPNRKIAQELDVGLRTVELRRSRIMKKLKADSFIELVRLLFTANIRPTTSR